MKKGKPEKVLFLIQEGRGSTECRGNGGWGKQDSLSSTELLKGPG